MSRFLSPLGIHLDGRDGLEPFAAAWQGTRTAAAASASSTLRGRDVTDRPAGWGHNYFCPDHSNALEFVETEPDRHRCADFDHLLTGEQYDSGWAYNRNIRLMEHLAASSVAAAVTSDRDHVRRAVTILTELGEVYPGLVLHGTKVGRAKLMHQSLEEAVAATSLARSFALVERWLSDQQRQLILDSLFAPMVEVIEAHLMDRPHNIEVWHLSGLASLAVVLDDAALARSTWQRTNGLRDQLAEGLRPDGWWYEGSPGYHFYMLTAVLDAVEAHRAIGLDTDLTDLLELMLTAPLQAARNDLTLPSFNDSHLATAVPPGLAVHGDRYFQGVQLCRSSELEAFLSSSASDSFDRASLGFLLYGTAELATTRTSDGWPTRRLDVFPDSGYATLRQTTAQSGDGPDTSVFLKFGPHGGSHGHPDKLEIELMVDGSRVIADPATTMYTNPIHEPWYVQTWSHSTVVVDRISQPPIKGRLLGHRQVSDTTFGCVDAEVCFGSEPDDEVADLVWDEADPARVAAYSGVKLRRVLAMVAPDLGSYLLDLVVVTAPRPSCIDLITHVRGESAPAGRGAPSRVLLPGFRHVRQLAEPSGRTDYVLSDGGRPWTRWHTGASELYTAVTPSNPSHESCASTVERVVGPRAVFASVLPLGGQALGRQALGRQATIAGVTMTADGVDVMIGDDCHHWHAPSVLSDGQASAWTEPPITLDVSRPS